MPRSRRFILTLGMLTGIAALTVDLSLPAIPAMVEALATDLGKGQQIVGIFMAGMAFGQIPAGLFSDRFGRLPVLYGGMGLFAVFATIAAVANSIDLMLAARFMQGFGAASAVVVSRAVVRDISSGKEAAKLMSLMTMIFTAAPVIAPSLGALLIAWLGWRAPFSTIALAAFLLLIAIRLYLTETHTPDQDRNPVRQLQSSISEFFSHRQSIYGLLFIVAAPAGFMSIITVAAALTTEMYGFSLQAFGLIFACAGLSILLGSLANRLLMNRLDVLQIMSITVALIALAGLQLAWMVWQNEAHFWWLWANVCVYMLTAGMLLPNATVLAMDPLPKTAGVASSILGTLSNITGAGGALLGAVIYDGSVRNALIIMACMTGLIVVIYLLRPLIAPHACIEQTGSGLRD